MKSQEMNAIPLSDIQVRRLRMRAQRLIPSLASPGAPVEQVLREVCGVQGQDLPAARLSVWVRAPGLAQAEIEAARQVTGSVVRTWVMRGTLHLVATEDARWLVPLLAQLMIDGDRRRMRGLGWDDERTVYGLRLVEEALARQGTLTRPEIQALLKANGLPDEGQAPVHLIFRAAWEGILIQGADQGMQPAFVPCAEWTGGLQPRPRPEALAELARRYLQAYAPATERDFSTWSGLKMGEARLALGLIENELAKVNAAREAAWMLQSRLPWIDELDRLPPVVRLLPRYDTCLLGYASRDLVVAPQFAGRINAGGGVLHQVVLIDGAARGLWTAKPAKGRLEVIIEPFEPLSREMRPGLEAEAADLGRFLRQETVLRGVTG
jgi:hypothetical protein